jgi:hypothetical protein
MSEAAPGGVPTLQAGVARADITPPVGIAHANWGAATHSRAEGIDLPLWATVLALRDVATDTTAVIVDFDLLHLSLSLAGALREAVAGVTGVPRAHVRVSATHTHSGPTLGPTWVEEGAELIEAYVASLPGRVAGAAWEAMRRLVPVRVAAGTGSCRIGVNRRVVAPDGRMIVGRNPAGFFDPTVRVLRIDRAAGAAGVAGTTGEPLAVVVHYATHPTIMAYENRLITPDYPGAVRRTVEAIGGATCLFLQGCAGDIGPAVGFTEGHTGDTSYYRRAGAILGAEAARVWLTLETHPADAELKEVLESGAPLGIYRDVPRPEPDGTLRVATATAVLPVRPFPTAEEGLAGAQAARAALAALRRAGASEDAVREATWKAKRLAQQAGHSRLTDGRSEVEVELQAMRIGPAALVAGPMEVFNALGAAVAAASPYAWTAVSGYSNGSTGYLPTAAAFDGGGYEVEMASPYARGAGERFVEAAGDLLNRLY